MAIAPQVAVSESFLTALAQLPKPIQKKVREFTAKFRANPTSSAINYESLHGMRDPKVRTVRIDLSYRAVVVHPQTGALYMLVWVDNHDEAMAWAENKIFDINATTGAIQVVDMQFVAKALEATPIATKPTGVFAALSDTDLARTGLPDVLVPAVRAVQRDEELEKLQPYLPLEAFEALYLVAAGSDLETAIRESSRPPIAEPTKPVDTSDFAAALQKPASRRQFRLIESEDELEEMLDASIDKWRVFLHPTQDAIVRANFRGPARVLGGAGTGKTVVAMHRARHLAKLYPDGKILFTAFNRNLATNIAGLLDTLCGKAERERIEVANIHSWAVKYASKQLGPVTIVTPTQEAECWTFALAKGRALDWTDEDYKAEWDGVILFHGITTRDAYFRASRAGSPKTLKRAERAAIWEGFAAYRAELDRRKLSEWTDVVRKVREYIEKDGTTPYRAIVVDEAQDIDAEQWRLLRALAPNEDNSLFITGDGHQRIYGKPITLSQFGINIRGRSYRLKINYRTTEQILRWATKLLAGVEVDDLDGDTDNTVGYRSLYTGPEPDVRTFASSSAETAFLIDHVRALSEHTPPEEIAIVAKTKQRLNAYAAALDGAGITHTVLDGDAVGPGVRVATMHRVKGLDFTHVLMHMSKGRPVSGDPRDQSLLYVAATRCRKTLSVLVS